MIFFKCQPGVCVLYDKGVNLIKKIYMYVIYILTQTKNKENKILAKKISLVF